MRNFLDKVKSEGDRTNKNMTVGIENIERYNSNHFVFYIFKNYRPLATFWFNLEGLTPSRSEVMICQS